MKPIVVIGANNPSQENFMKKRSPSLIALAFLASLSIVVPPDLPAQVAQRAGQISRAIPDVAIARGAQQLPAIVKTLVDWGDVVKTGDGGRARVALDDGSVLNVGSSSSLTVTQHNAGAQQTQIELTYGRVRSQVIKQSKPNAKFEIHTAVGVAGVVGTDFFLGYMNGLFQIIVYEGHVKFCNLDGICVDVLAGQLATIRDGHQAPDQPSQATPSELTDAANATSVGVVAGNAPPAHPISIGWIIALTATVVIPAIVVPIATSGKRPPKPGNTCVTNPNFC
jgi:hypothetical protein